ncbi:MAG: hypothetical protein QOF56_3899 [Acidobacteriaceae bacterium]|jgi:hypothetical protein|nr:hypothetical protein [Acidobacteriaceae bacterium]
MLVGVSEKDKALLAGTKGTEGAAQARGEDAFQASSAIMTQLRDAAASFLNLGPVISGKNALADKMSAGISAFDKGTAADKTGALIGTGLLGAGATAASVMGAKGIDRRRRIDCCRDRAAGKCRRAHARSFVAVGRKGTFRGVSWGQARRDGRQGPDLVQDRRGHRRSRALWRCDGRLGAPPVRHPRRRHLWRAVSFSRR